MIELLIKYLSGKGFENELQHFVLWKWEDSLGIPTFVKNLKMRYFFYFIVLVAFFITSCNNPQKENVQQEKAIVQSPQSNMGEEGTKNLMSVVENYYALKNTLVQDDEKKLIQAATSLNTSATDFRAFLAKDSTKEISFPQLDTIIQSTKNIQTLYPEGIVEKARIPFGKISDNMFSLLKQVDLKNAKIYRQYCPMAFNDKGAYWLSDNEEIENPYFGKKMLECGEVRDSLQ